MTEPTRPEESMPSARRLNHGVLVAAAAVMLVTVLAVVFVVAPRSPKPAAARPAPLAGSNPGFLEHPPGNLPVPAPLASEQEYLLGLLHKESRRAEGRQAEKEENEMAPEAGGVARASGAMAAGGEGAWAAGSRPPAGRGDPRREAFLRALLAPLAVTGAPRQSPQLRQQAAAQRQLGASAAGAASLWTAAGGGEGIEENGEGVAPEASLRPAWPAWLAAANPWPPWPPAPGGQAAAAAGGAGATPPQRAAGTPAMPATSAVSAPGAAAAAAAGTADDSQEEMRQEHREERRKSQGESPPPGQGASQLAGQGESGLDRQGESEPERQGEGRGQSGREDQYEEHRPTPRNAAAAAVRTAPRGAARSRFAGPAGGWRVRAGTVIPALLLTEINSDLPGAVSAQVSRNVYDERQETIVIPKGTRLLGRYDHQVAAGQRRLLVAWTRLLFPDGSELTLPGLPATAASGAAGLAGSVDNHTRRIFGDALLLSLLAAGAQLSQPQQSGLLQAPAARQVAAGALGGELASVATELVRRDIAIQPTLRIPAATAFNVFVNDDLVLPRQVAGD
ncbi:MAG TPA: TrbI/VirB10 family protein [Thermoanaerobaculia bacterium]|nr:TrbI/VirB10 family protein [Thermoanaerobaculia bacterium]